MPFLGRIVRGSGYIPNDLETEALVDACTRHWPTVGGLIVFPEGTVRGPAFLSTSIAAVPTSRVAGGRYPAGADK